MNGKGSEDNHTPPGAKTSSTIIAALDIGTSKISCFIAKLRDRGDIEVIGIGHQASSGLKSGTIIDLKAAEQAIGQAVHTAEKMAAPQMHGQQLRGVYVNVPGVHTLSHLLSVDVKISGHEITDKDIKSALAQARTVEVAGQDELIHAVPADFIIDGHRGIKEPRGMYGQKLGVQISAITAVSPAIRNINTVVTQNHLDIDGLCASPYASGLSCLVEDERTLGCTVIDIGGGTTSIAVFVEGKVVYTSAIPVGGIHVTNDLARGLVTSIADAERIKILYGSATTSPGCDNDLIDVPPVGEDEHTQPNHIPRSLLTGIIQPRLEETFELVRAKLTDSGIGQIAGRRVVLTGGASQLPGLAELGQHILDKKIRLGRPAPLKGVAESVAGPAFSTTAGLLVYAAEHADDQPQEDKPLIQVPGGLLQRVTHWLRENW